VRELWRRLQVAFGGLSTNERVLVSVAGGLLAVALLWFAVAIPLLSAADRASTRAETAEEELDRVRALRARFDEVNGRLGAVEARIQSGPTGEIFTTLESMASQSAVKIDSMEPRTAAASDEYRETKVQVALKGVTLAQVVGFLSKIDSAAQMLSIKSLRIRTRATSRTRSTSPSPSRPSSGSDADATRRRPGRPGAEAGASGSLRRWRCWSP
jgi:type II secretory pathway component PulM